jgi:hypothetical protein
LLVVPTGVRVRFAEFLAQRGVAQIYVNRCQKWLRYYLDFCVTYQHDAEIFRRLDAFLVKLSEKSHNVATRKEAQRDRNRAKESLSLKRNPSRGLTAEVQSL